MSNRARETAYAVTDAESDAGSDSEIDSETEAGRSIPIAELNAQCELEWEAFAHGRVSQPPSFRKYARCAELHKKYINSMHGATKGGQLFILCRNVRKYFFKRSLFKLSSTCTNAGARRALIEFVNNASSIIAAQDALKRHAAKRPHVQSSNTTSTPSDTKRRKSNHGADDGTNPSLESVADAIQSLGESRTRRHLNVAQTVLAKAQLDLHQPQIAANETQTELNKSRLELVKVQTERERLNILALKVSIMKDLGATQEALKRLVTHSGISFETAV